MRTNIIWLEKTEFNKLAWMSSSLSDKRKQLRPQCGRFRTQFCKKKKKKTLTIILFCQNPDSPGDWCLGTLALQETKWSSAVCAKRVFLTSSPLQGGDEVPSGSLAEAAGGGNWESGEAAGHGEKVDLSTPSSYNHPSHLAPKHAGLICSLPMRQLFWFTIFHKLISTFVTPLKIVRKEQRD